MNAFNIMYDVLMLVCILLLYLFRGMFLKHGNAFYGMSSERMQRHFMCYLETLSSVYHKFVN
jgi:hypothetical protein